MYLRYGLSHHPGYCKIDLRPMFLPGGFSHGQPSTIYIMTKTTHEEAINGINDEVFDTVCHETGHFLHPAGRRWYNKKRITNKNRFLAEVVADLGAIIFVSEKYGEERVKRYIEEMNVHSTFIAQDIFTKNPKLLEEIADLEIRKAGFLIRPILNRPLYPENLSAYFRLP